MRRRLLGRCLFVSLLVGLLGSSLGAQERFSTLVGNVPVGPVKSSAAVELPYITWGGDVATFRANGGLKTTPGSIFKSQGLNFDMRAGDDFVDQVRRYMKGDTPFLRGTMRMLGQASEVIGKDSRTKAVVFLQLTWSAGDHMIARSPIKTLDQLRGKKIVLQQGGPHVGMLDDILRTAKLSWNDVQIVWAKDLTGPAGPGAKFKADSTIDACLVISPDMFGLSGGLASKGTGAEGTVRGAHVLVFTATMSRSIADVYACRKDYYDANKSKIQDFVAGYLRSCEEIESLKKQFDDKGSSSEYSKTLKMAIGIYGEEVVPNEEEAHGLISDCTFAHLPGNQRFFLDEGNTVGFKAKEKAALDLATSRGYASVRAGFFPPALDYDAVKSKGSLKLESLAIKAPTPVANGSQRTIFSFTINFDANQTDFSREAYYPEFQRVVENASLFGNAIIAVRGHADPYQTLRDLVAAGVKKGVLKKFRQNGKLSYTLNGRPLDLSSTRSVVQAIEGGSFDGTQPNPRQTLQAALNLSQRRAESVRNAIVAYAKSKGLIMVKEQLKPEGVGIREPVIAKPRSPADAARNRRVEFSIIEVQAEATEFDEL